MRATSWLMLLVAAVPLAVVQAASLQATVTDEAGKPVAGVAVYAVPTTPDPRPPRNAAIDQVKRQFVPQMLVVQRGASVTFPNSDNVRHSVYSFSAGNAFERKLYAGRDADPVKFANAGIVALGCNIHDKMAAWVLVVDTPFFGRTRCQWQGSAHRPCGGQICRARLASEDARRAGG